MFRFVCAICIVSLLGCLWEFTGKPLPLNSWSRTAPLCFVVITHICFSCRIGLFFSFVIFRTIWGPCSRCSVTGGGRQASEERMEPGSDLPSGGAGSLTSPGRGGILYCVIARGTTVLARFSCLVSYGRCGWFIIQSSGMPHVLGTLQRSVILFWQRQDLLPPISAIKKFILKGARTKPGQDDTGSGRIPLPLRLWRRGDCLSHCRYRVLPVFRYSNFFTIQTLPMIEARRSDS